MSATEQRPSVRVAQVLDPPPKRIATDAAWRFGANLLFPHLAYLSRWPSRLGPRGSAVYVLTCAVVGGAFVGSLTHLARREEEAADALRAELGREPTRTEIAEWLGWDPPPVQG